MWVVDYEMNPICPFQGIFPKGKRGLTASFHSSELVVEARGQGNTFLQACPACDMEVQRIRVVFGGFGGPAGF